MTTIERGPRATDRFAIIANDALADERLSYRARGLLAYLLSRPEGWRTNSDALATQGREGRDAIRTALRELEDAGYLTRTRARDDAGRWAHTAKVHDRPTMKPSDGFPGAGSPGAGGPAADGQAISSKTERKTESKTSAPTERADAASERPPAADAWVAQQVYEATDKGVRFMAVRAVAGAVLRARDPLHQALPEGPTTQNIMAAMVGLYRAGKPITITTVCQVLDGALQLNGASSLRAAKDRTAFREDWQDGTAVAEWEAVAGRPVQ